MPIGAGRVWLPWRRYGVSFGAVAADGNLPSVAMRCLKRRLADDLWRLMITDERRLTADNVNIAG
jgi:transposase